MPKSKQRFSVSFRASPNRNQGRSGTRLTYLLGVAALMGSEMCLADAINHEMLVFET